MTIYNIRYTLDYVDEILFLFFSHLGLEDRGGIQNEAGSEVNIFRTYFLLLYVQKN